MGGGGVNGYEWTVVGGERQPSLEVWLVDVGWWSWGVTLGWARYLVGPLRFEFGCVFCGIFATGVVLNDLRFTNMFALLIGELVGWGWRRFGQLGVFISIPEEV